MLIPSPLESSHLGLKTYRATPAEVDPSALFDEMLAAGVDLAILRVPSRMAIEVARLTEFGLPVIHADTLVTYACPLQDLPPPGTRVPPGIVIDRARDSDRAAVTSLIAEVFARYPNHYAANPLLDPKAVLEGYTGWALSHLERGHRLMWVARSGDRIAGIACSAFDPITGECRGVLHAVRPEFARRGIYRALIQHTQRHFRDAGYARLIIATQAWNVAVQRFWARSRFSLVDVVETFHVNALLDAAHGETATTEFAFRNLPAGEQAARIFASIPQAGEQPARDKGRWQHAFTPLSALAEGKTHTLRTRAYTFTGARVQRVVVGMLYDSGLRPCAIARSTLFQTPSCRSHLRSH